MGQCSDIKKLVRQLCKEGWSLEITKKHWKIRHPKGRLVSFSATPSDRNAINNFRRDINRVKKEYGEQRI